MLDIFLPTPIDTIQPGRLETGKRKSAPVRQDQTLKVRSMRSMPGVTAVSYLPTMRLPFGISRVRCVRESYTSRATIAVAGPAARVSIREVSTTGMPVPCVSTRADGGFSGRIVSNTPASLVAQPPSACSPNSVSAVAEDDALPRLARIMMTPSFGPVVVAAKFFDSSSLAGHALHVRAGAHLLRGIKLPKEIFVHWRQASAGLSARQRSRKAS